MSTTTTRRKRLHMLDATERQALYDRPLFNEADRTIGFACSPEERLLVDHWTDPVVQAFFILQLGYFKAKSRFFTLHLEDLSEDLTYILHELGGDPTTVTLRLPNRRTIQEQRTTILAHTHYRVAHKPERTQLAGVALQAARVSPKPQYLLGVVLQHCATERIIVPAYTTLQEQIIGAAITAEERRLVALLQQHGSPADRALLEALFTPHETDGQYRLTHLRRVPRSLRPRQLSRERERGTEFQPLVTLAARLLPLLDLSPAAVAYYASLVGYYTATRLRELRSGMVSVYLLCFIQHRYQRHHDYLLSGLMHAVKGIRATANEAANDDVAAYQVTLTENIVRAGRILQLFTDPTVPAGTPFGTVQERAFALLDPPSLTQAATYLATGAGCDPHAFFSNVAKPR